jgi:hypothetical protein
VWLFPTGLTPTIETDISTPDSAIVEEKELYFVDDGTKR